MWRARSKDHGPIPTRLLKADWFVVLVLVASAVYLAMAWTPSSYALALRIAGAADDGLVIGTPRPIRSDEWTVITPQFQTALNNGYKRFNETSPYREDLRSFLGLPLKDWALPFKPFMWLFFVSSAAYGFSFYHVFFIAGFLIGYHLLLQALGFNKSFSVCGALLLFFCGFTQAWWSALAQTLAVFPWLLLGFLGNWHWLRRLLWSLYLVPVWLLGYLYAPQVISLVFAGAVIVLAFRPRALLAPAMLASILGGVVGAALVAAYLQDAIVAMAATVYPGARIVSGGSVSLPQFVAQFFPFFVTKWYDSLIGANICEVSTAGSYLLPLTLVFLDHRDLARRLRDPAQRDLRRQLGVLAVGIAALTAWMILPIPASVGRVLLWHRVPPVRMMFTEGLLLLLFGLTLLRAGVVRLGWGRFLAAAGVVAIAWIVSKGMLAGSRLFAGESDLYIIILLLPLVALRGRFGPWAGVALLSCVVAANIIVWGRFNPVQSARPIFQREPTAFTRQLEDQQQHDPRHWLVVEEGPPGAILNGWGFRSLSHVLLLPRLEFFRPYFPELPEEEFNGIFNRYAHIRLRQVDKPFNPYADVAVVPSARFAAPAR